MNNAIEKDNVESYCLKHVYFYFLEYLIYIYIFFFFLGHCPDFLLVLTTDSRFYLELYSQSRPLTQNSQWDVCTVEQKATIFLPL